MIEGDGTFLDSWIKIAAEKLAADGMASPDPTGDWLLSQIEGLAQFCSRYPIVGSALEEAYDPRLNHMIRGGHGLVEGWPYRYVTEVRPDVNAAGALAAVAEILGNDARLEELVGVTWAVTALRFDWNKLFLRHEEAHP